jgi:glycosyltransferase involved in cell wall biosynthesis
MVLPIGALIKWIRGTALIYDPHELETERINLRGTSQKVSRFIERKLIYAADQTIVVSKSIQRWYKETYNLKNVFLLRNIPVYTKPDDQKSTLKEQLQISVDEILFIYQGLLMNGRSIGLYLEVFKRLDPVYHIVFMGYGPLEAEVQAAAGEHSNIHYQPAVSPEKIISYSSGCDIGLHVPENICLSYYYSLPNKFFEYIVADLPLIVSNFPDMSEIVGKYDIGWTVDVSEDALLDCIKSLDRNSIARKKKNLSACKASFTWQSEEKVLLEVYNGINQVKH